MQSFSLAGGYGSSGEHGRGAFAVADLLRNSNVKDKGGASGTLDLSCDRKGRRLGYLRSQCRGLKAMVSRRETLTRRPLRCFTQRLSETRSSPCSLLEGGEQGSPMASLVLHTASCPSSSSRALTSTFLWSFQLS